MADRVIPCAERCDSTVDANATIGAGGDAVEDARERDEPAIDDVPPRD